MKEDKKTGSLFRAAGIKTILEMDSLKGKLCP